MSAVMSSVVLIGKNWPQSKLGFSVLENHQSAISLLQSADTADCDVIAISSDWLENRELDQSLRVFIASQSHLRLIVRVDRPQSSEKLLQWLSSLPISHFLNPGQEEIDQYLLSTLEKAQSFKQDKELQQLVKEQHEQLRYLYMELENRLAKRQEFLQEARKKNFLAHSRWETLRNITVAAHQAASINELENYLTESLVPMLQLNQCRIIFNNQSNMGDKIRILANSFSAFSSPILRPLDRQSVGIALFLRAKDRPFFREETDFLIKVTEVLSLAIDRMRKFDQVQALKEQWEVTFNSFTDPIILIDRDYQLLQTNKIVANKNSKDGKCFEVLFQRESPCSGCNRGRNFKIVGGNPKATYSVHSISLPSESGESEQFVLQYHDISQRLLLESTMLENAKAAEMGIIGSSIAHEINNPLAGMLSYLYLIKEDLPESDPLIQDIEIMEDGVRRCKRIIEDLLSFVRKPDPDKKSRVDLNHVIELALKKVELQYRYSRPTIRWSPFPEPIFIEGHPNLLEHCFLILLQKALTPNSQGQIVTGSQKIAPRVVEIFFVEKDRCVELHLLDNSPDQPSEFDFRSNLVQKILLDYGANIEFFSPQAGLRSAKITLPGPVLSQLKS